MGEGGEGESAPGCELGRAGPGGREARREHAERGQGPWGAVLGGLVLLFHSSAGRRVGMAWRVGREAGPGPPAAGRRSIPASRCCRGTCVCGNVVAGDSVPASVNEARWPRGGGASGGPALPSVPHQVCTPLGPVSSPGNRVGIGLCVSARVRGRSVCHLVKSYTVTRDCGSFRTKKKK